MAPKKRSANDRSIRRIKSDGDSVLRRVVTQWADNVEQLVTDWSDTGDLPWLYTERALLSVMAAGVWQLRGTAFEEYRSEKRSSPSQRNLKRPGREDLHFSLGGRGFKAEAKHVWAPGTRLATRSNLRIQARLTAAVEDVRLCSPAGQERLGILFAVPYLAKRHSNLTDLINQWLEVVFERIPCAAAAATFPRSVRAKCSWPGDGYAYPGAAVFIRRA